VAKEAGPVIDPIHQFEIYTIGQKLSLFGTDISFTNSSLFMVVSLAVIAFIMIFGSRGKALVPGRLQSAAEILYEFVAGTITSTIGKEGMKFMPLVFSLFMFILTCNLVGLVPGAYTVTSQIIVTFSLAVLVILTVFLYGVVKHGFHFFGLFKPSGVPVWLLPFIIPIEVISFLSRPISLAMRLFANMLAGHIALKVFAGFIVTLSAAGGWVVLSPMPMLMIVSLTALEFLVAGLQAFVFSILTCIYLNDALHPGH
jgi:F-type H+-transporting ATPase subunit a